MRVRFGDFVLDSERRELLRGNEALRLRPKAFELLQALIAKRPNAVSQEELYDTLWPDTFVERTNLHKLMHHVRTVLGDRDQTIIRTVYGFGFAFEAISHDAESAAILVKWQIVVGDREFELHEGENIVGRERDAPVRIDAPSISRRHARILIDGERVTVEDLGSKNGTCVSGKRVHQCALADGDSVLFGTVAGSFRAVPTERSTESVR
jgi:DNA-binding winged helix-turn-helix (wHTH) protein